MKIIVIVSILLLVILIILVIPNVNVKNKSGLVVNPTYNSITTVGKTIDYGNDFKWDDTYSTYLGMLRPKSLYTSSDGEDRCVKNVSTEYIDFDLSLWNLKDNPPNIDDTNIISCKRSIDSRYGFVVMNIIVIGKVPTSTPQTLRLDSIDFFNNFYPLNNILIEDIIIYPKSNNSVVLNNGVMSQVITAPHLEPKIMLSLGAYPNNLTLIEFSAGVNISNYYIKLYRGWGDGAAFPIYNESIPIFEKIYPSDSTLTGDKIYTEKVNVSDTLKKDVTLRFDASSCENSGCVDTSNNLHLRQYYIDRHGRCFKPYSTVDYSIFESDIASTSALTTQLITDWESRYLRCPDGIGGWEILILKYDLINVHGSYSDKEYRVDGNLITGSTLSGGVGTLANGIIGSSTNFNNGWVGWFKTDVVITLHTPSSSTKVIFYVFGAPNSGINLPAGVKYGGNELSYIQTMHEDLGPNRKVAKWVVNIDLIAGTHVFTLMSDYANNALNHWIFVTEIEVM